AAITPASRGRERLESKASRRIERQLRNHALIFRVAKRVRHASGGPKMKFNATNLSRRSLLMAGAVFGGAGMVGLFSRLATANEGDTIVVKPGKVSIERFDDAGKSLGVESVDKVIKSEDEWKQVLADAPQAALAFYV